jgi:hypothetical protein
MKEKQLTEYRTLKCLKASLYYALRSIAYVMLIHARVCFETRSVAQANLAILPQKKCPFMVRSFVYCKCNLILKINSVDLISCTKINK